LVGKCAEALGTMVAGGLLAKVGYRDYVYAKYVSLEDFVDTVKRTVLDPECSEYSLGARFGVSESGAEESSSLPCFVRVHHSKNDLVFLEVYVDIPSRCDVRYSYYEHELDPSIKALEPDAVSVICGERWTRFDFEWRHPEALAGKLTGESLKKVLNWTKSQALVLFKYGRWL